MSSLWSEFLGELHQPEYVHVLLNPLPIYGLALALLALALALVFRSREAQAVALILIVVTAAAAWPVAYFGSAGYDRVYSMSDESAQKWLNWHAYLADRIVWAHSIAAAFASAALVALWKYPRVLHPALILTVLAALTAVSLGGFLAFAGGKIRHAEFRHAPPPAWAHTAPDQD
jgi:glucan phosphoethanolaminetransferase (alkaline phosphatase superfamily)